MKKTNYHKFELFRKAFKKQTGHDYKFPGMLSSEINNISRLKISYVVFYRFIKWALRKKRLKNTFFLLALLNEYRARSEKEIEEEVSDFFRRLKAKKENVVLACKKCKGVGFKILKKKNDEEYIRICDCECVTKFRIYQS